MTPSRLAPRVLAALATTALLASALASGAQAADTTAPVLTGFRVTPRTVGPDQVVTIDYTAAEDTGSLAEAAFVFRYSTYTYTAKSAPGTAPTAGSVTLALPNGTPDGVYQLLVMRLTDAAGNTSFAQRSGAITYSSGASGPASHTFAFADSDLTLTGSVPDTVAPTLSSMTVADRDLTVGDTAAIDYAVDDTSLLKSVAVSYRNEDTSYFARFSVFSADALPRSGTLTRLVDAGWPNGRYTVQQVDVTDRWGNVARYLSDGRLLANGTTTTHTLDLAVLAFTVSGSTADYDPPVLTAVGRPSSPVLAGGTVSMSYAVTDAAASLESVSARFVDNDWNTITISRSGAPLSGTLTGTAIPAPTAARGSYRLESVRVLDLKGNVSEYYSWGLLVRSHAENSSHTLDLADHTLTVAGTPSAVPWMSVSPAPGAATVRWEEPADLGGTPVTGYTLTVSPSGKVVSTNGTARQATVTGLTNTVKYTFTVRARNPLGPGPGRNGTGTPRPFGLRILSPGDFDEDGHNDILAVNRASQMLFYRGNGRGGFAAAGKAISGGWQVNRLVVPRLGPLDAGRQPDAWTIRFDGSLQKYGSSGNGNFQYSDQRGTGWDKFAKVITPGDWGGDFEPDVMGITDAGELYYYRHKWETGSFYPGVRIGTGWNAFSHVFTMGDQTGDWRDDLVAVKPDGTIWLYAGNGKGGFSGAARRIGSGLGGVRAAFSTDFDGGGPDLLTVDSRGNLRLYRGNNRAGFAYRGVIGTGWHAFL